MRSLISFILLEQVTFWEHVGLVCLHVTTHLCLGHFFKSSLTCDHGSHNTNNSSLFVRSILSLLYRRLSERLISRNLRNFASAFLTSGHPIVIYSESIF